VSRLRVLVPSLLAPLAVAALASPRAASAAGDPALEALLQRKAPTVVCVRYVLKAKLSIRGQANDQESNREIRGAAVDASGLVVVGNDAFEGGISAGQLARLKQMGGEYQASPGDVKVLFGNEAKEHEAVVVAKDSRLGLTYLQIVEPEAKPPAVVDVATAVEVGVGQPLFVVTRLARGFDCAPVVSRLLVTGRVEKPRAMWSVVGDADNVGLPVYEPSGAMAGLLVTQQGSAGVEDDDGGSSETFLLPMADVLRSLEQAKKRAPEALAKAREARDAAAKEREAAPKEPETPAAPPAEPGMGEPAK
jgi:hypothetical protein